MQLTERRRTISPARQARRDAIEEEFRSAGCVPAVFLRLITVEGFIDYYLEMRELYPTYKEAYERLEDFYIDFTGHRKYSEFSSFRRVMTRWLRDNTNYR
jgi:hypothetical protein